MRTILLSWLAMAVLASSGCNDGSVRNPDSGVDAAPDAGTDAGADGGPVDGADQEPEECGGLDPPLSDLTLAVGPMRLGIVDADKKHTGAVSYFIVSDGMTFAGLEYVDPPREILVKVLDPDEEVIYWEYHDGEGDFYESGGEPTLPEVICLGRAGVYQIRAWAAEAGSGHPKNLITLHLTPGTGYGVSFQYGFFQDWTGMPDPMFVWAPLHRHIPLQFSLTEFKPPGQPQPPLSIAVYDESDGDAPLVADPASGSADVSLDPSDTEDHHLLRVESQASGWRFRVGSGYPFILASSRAAADGIHGSLERVPTGPFQGLWVAHKFQLEIAELIPQMLAHAGDRQTLYSASPLNYPGTIEECYDPADPEDISRHYSYIHWYQGTFPAARFSLFTDSTNSDRPYHNMQPNSRWLGAYRYDAGAGSACATDDQCLQGTCVFGKCETEFWDTFASTTSEGRSIGNGLSTEHGFPSCQIHAAIQNHPCNFYGPDPSGSLQYPEMLVRGSMSALFNLLFVMESDRFLLPDLNSAFYSGAYQLNGFYNLVAAFGEAGSALPGAIPMGVRAQRAWQKGLRQVIDRTYTQVMVSSLNQNSHTTMAMLHFPRGMTDPGLQAGYRALARRWAERFVGEQHPAGYFREGAGIDATYTGITHNFIGFYYRMTEQDPEGPDTLMLEAIRKSYQFYNHTIAREPSANYLGSFDFANRTAGDFAHEQYAGARGIIEQLGEVSYRVPLSDGDNSALQSRALNFETAAQFVFDYTDSGGGSHNTMGILSEGQFKDPSRRPGDYILPAHREESFTLNVHDADTLIAVKRPGYYATVFVGNPTAQFVLDYYRSLFQQPHPDEGLSPDSAPGFNGHGPLMSDGSQHVHPFLGGGISFLHTESFGSLMVGANWNPHTHHGLVAELADGTRRWTRYHSRSFSFDDVAGTLTTGGQLKDLPLELTRTLTFLDDRIEVELQVTATADATLSGFYEVFPLPTCSRSPCTGTVVNRKQNGSHLSGLGTEVGDGFYDTTTDAFSLVDDSATTGLTVTLDGPGRITASQHGMRYRAYSDEFQIGWVKVHLPGNWSANDTHTLQYSIIPQ